MRLLKLAVIFLPCAFYNQLLLADSTGKGQLSVDYQYIHVDGFQSSEGELDIGTTDTHSLNFEVAYDLNERWSVSAGIPLIMKRYNGPAPHDPSALDPPRNSKFIDDGNYHTNFQDFYFAVEYRAVTGPLSISPIVTLGIPSNNYVFYAGSAVGQNLWKAGVGANFNYLPLFHDFYFSITPLYVFVEKTLGTNINHWLIDLEAGLLLNKNWTIRLFSIIKQGNGKDVPEDFPPPRTDENWYQHDRTIKHNYINVGAGFNYSIGPKYSLTFTAMTMVHGEQVYEMKYLFGLGIVRYF